MSVESMGMSASVSADALSQSGSQSVSALSKAQASEASQPSLPKVEEPKSDLSVEKLEAAIDKLNEMMTSDRRSINFSVDEDAGRVVVKVIDKQTNELIRQIPTEETLKFAEHLEGVMGVIFNDKA